MVHFIRRLNVIFIIFFSTVFLIGCCKSFVINKKKISGYPETSIPFKTSNYAYIEMNISSIDEKITPPGLLSWSGSGSVIKHNDEKTYVLTAGHVCVVNVTDEMITVFGDPNKKEHTHEVSILIQDFSKRSFKGKVKAVSEDHDICIIEADGKFGKPIVMASKDPKLGDQLWTISSPLGVGVKNSAPILTGHYSGMDARGEFMITIPSAPGSSGGMVTNKRGEGVCLIYAVIIEFHHISLCVGRENVIDFINENL